MTPLRERMIEDLRICNYSPSTISIYVRQVAVLFLTTRERKSDEFSPQGPSIPLRIRI